MAQADVIGPLFESVLQRDILRYNINNADIKTGIRNMKEVYKPNPGSLTSQSLAVANYNDVAHRCAYLHKYAPFHTALVADMLVNAMQSRDFKQAVMGLIQNHGGFEICSLGGGPGNDVLGVLSVLVSHFGFFQVSATVIDCMLDWNATFSSLIGELRGGDYGDLSEIVQPQYFSWNYLGHNLLGKMSNDVNKAIQGAHMITMVKFVSASASKGTPEMLLKIFRSLRPGGLIFYIDNAGGGFHQIIQKCAYECRLHTIFGPLKHQLYSTNDYNVKRFGYTPCLETTVTFHVWRKNSNENISVDTRIFNATVNQYNITNTNMFFNQRNPRANNRQFRRAERQPPRRQRALRNAENRQCANVDEEDELEEYEDNSCCVIL